MAKVRVNIQFIKIDQVVNLPMRHAWHAREWGERGYSWESARRRWDAREGGGRTCGNHWYWRH